MQKKSLTGKVSATKKPNVAATPAKNEGSTTRKIIRRPTSVKWTYS
jgi:hypothetical protein